ncbi:MAG: NAD-dependent epimerase/dehydratase family protein [Candidatus Methylomirabilis sp.]|nr:NAD-dependent epimerase/dehydratase family protein [Deltaproteobacteria bacterium]
MSAENVTEYRPRFALVTGGAGFIGSHVVQTLLKEGVKVRVMVKPGEPTGNLDGLDIEQVEGDLLNPDSLRRALEGVDTLFHMAAIYAIWLPDPSLMYKVNVLGTISLFNIAKELGIEKVVYTSSVAAVGTGEGPVPSTEETIFNNWLTADHYIYSKYLSENEAIKFNLKGLPVTAVNPVLPIGWGDIAPTPTGDLVMRYVSGKNPVWFPGGMNAANVRDVARGHWLAALRGRPGERYILGGENITYKDFGFMVCRVAGVGEPKYEVKPGIIEFLGTINEWLSTNVTHKKPMFVNKGMKSIGGRYLYFDISKAKRELGYDPGPLEGAVKEAVDWFKNGRDAALAKGKK